MASRMKFLGFVDILNRSSNVTRQISKVTANNGWNNLRCSTASASTAASLEPSDSSSEMVESSRAMQAYLKRTKDHETFMKQQKEEYEKGKQFLAKIMGKNPNEFDQDEIDEAIKYLFPSALYQTKARPHFKDPEELFEKVKEAQFDQTGRPYHFLFYTVKPNYTEVLYNCAKNMHQLNEKLMKLGPDAVPPKVPLDIAHSDWLSKANLESLFMETLLDIEYDKFIEAMDELAAHPYSYEAASFIMKYRKPKFNKVEGMNIPKAVDIGNGISAVKVDSRRKRCFGNVTVLYPGTGKVTINGKSLIEMFSNLQSRHQVLLSRQYDRMVFT